MAANKGKMNYIISGNLTEDAILTPELLKVIGTKAVGDRELPKDGSLKLKDPEHFDYHNRSVKFHYPGSGENNGLVVPDAAIYNELFEHFGKNGAFIGIPIWVRDGLLAKLKNQGITAITEEVGIADDEQFWWMRKGFTDPKPDEEYITTEDDDGEMAYPSWAALFKDYPTPVLANTTCSFTLSCRTPVGTGISGKETWKLSCTPSVFNVVDATDIQKPKSTIQPKRIPGKKDRMRKGLQARRAQHVS